MRLNYKINNQTCNFHKNRDRCYHEIENLFSLFQLNSTEREITLREWEGYYTYQPNAPLAITREPASLHCCIPEDSLLSFIESVRSITPSKYSLAPELLLKRILRQCKVSIFNMKKPSVLLCNSSTQNEFKTLVRFMYVIAYGAMESATISGLHSAQQEKEFAFIKRFFPPAPKTINPNNLFSLFINLAPIWPKNLASPFDEPLKKDIYKLNTEIITQLNDKEIPHSMHDEFFYGCLNAMCTEQDIRHNRNAQDSPEL